MKAKACSKKATSKGQSAEIRQPTDDELADRWIEKHIDEGFGLGCFRMYDQGVWIGRPTEDVENEVLNELIAAKVEGINPNSGRLSSVMKLIKIKINKPDSKWDNVTNYLPLQNGLLDLFTFELIPHSPANFITSTLPYSYDPYAKSPNWDKALSSLDKDDADTFQEFGGYSLTGDTKLETIVWLLGPSGCGKSTLIGGLQSMLGPRSYSLGLREMENSRFNLSNLVGKTLMVATEQPRTWITITDIINRICSGEKITVEKKGKDSFEMTPTTKMIFASTEYPVIPSSKDGIYRRLRFIEIPAILEKDRDPDFKNKINKERAGILNRAIEGLKRLRERGHFQIPESRYLASENYKPHDELVKQFVNECCEIGPDNREQAQPLYDGYKHWCNDHGHIPKRTNDIAGEWKRLGFTPTTIKGLHYWKGIVLNHSGDIQHDYNKEILINRDIEIDSTPSTVSSTIPSEWYTSGTDNNQGG